MIKITLDDSYIEKCSEEILWLDYKNITKVVDVGSKIYIDDGLISLQVNEIGKCRKGLERLKSASENLRCLFKEPFSLSSSVFSCIFRFRLPDVRY